jgi:type IV pilus assembly protein PilE
MQPHSPQPCVGTGTRTTRVRRWRVAGKRMVRGFTLVELMVAMLVAVLLSAIAMAAYRNYTLQAQRSAALAALSDAASRQEQFFLNNRSYTATLGAGGLNVSESVSGGAYLLSIDAPSAACPLARCWSMQATPQGRQADDRCGTLSINSDGDRAPAGCW